MYLLIIMSTAVLKYSVFQFLLRHPYLKPFYNAYENKLISSYICKIQKTCYINCVIPKSLPHSRLRFIDNDPFNTLSERILKHPLDTIANFIR